MKVNNITIIGVGNLGSRHLQALKKTKQNINIDVVGRSDDSLNTAKVRYDELPNNKYVKQITYHKQLDSLPNNLDIVIIATNSDVRKEIIKNLVEIKKVKFLILEKVTFTSDNDFKEIITLLKEKNIKSWVNCQHRTYAYNKYIKNMIEVDKNTIFKYEGNDWGIACNTIHFLDLINYIFDDEIVSLNNKLLDKIIHDSKREGFIEFTGTLQGCTKKGNTFELTSHFDSKDIHSIQTIESKNKICTINFLQNELIMYDKKNQSKTVEKCIIPFQSELTHNLVNELLDFGTCPLSTLEESYVFHKLMLESFQNHLKDVTGNDYNSCPIT